MNTKDYKFSITVDATPKEAFDAINNVTGWWIDSIDGSSKKLNDEFSVNFFDGLHMTTQKIVEFVPDKKVVWLVTKSQLTFIKDQQEWNNTKIVFDLIPTGDKTRIEFTHIGLLPDIECFKDCSNAWGQYIRGSLANLINTGVGNPTPKEAKLVS